ncbi:transglutaminase family protein [Magnetofaba australis]|uniref:Putative transglutaminase domain-containing protein n=1 Tax=Magnetofaba australis IT-1 TaxID=1434232 RepID=A0A1Y2K2Y1_9PROT|nr:transglutaminase family protein [Magnetofaba australis]OSM02027.1 putative transglutaminase domain-containing protein [Magnetofaba australis IT-1]
MDYLITHITRYEYGDPVTICHNRAMLKPRDDADQRCLSFELEISPTPSFIQEQGDFFGNARHYFEIHEPHEVLEVTSRSHVRRIAHAQAPNLASGTPWEQLAQCEPHDEQDAGARMNVLYRQPSTMILPSDELRDLALACFTPGRPAAEAAMALTRMIFEEFEYDPNATDVTTPLADALSKRRGVCQDFAHVAIGALRSIGLCARYVSGYLETDPPPGQERLVGADASHAWFGLFDPLMGWVDFDPTNGVIVGPRHITVAVGRDYADTPPVKGVVVGGRQHQLSVSVDVAPQSGEAAPQNAALDGGEVVSGALAQGGAAASGSAPMSGPIAPPASVAPIVGGS